MLIGVPADACDARNASVFMSKKVSPLRISASRGPHAGHGQRDSAYRRAQRLTLDREIEVEVRFLPFDPCLDLLVQVAQRQYDFPGSVPVQAAQQIIEERPAAYGGHTFGDGAYRIPQACSEAAGQNDAGRICDGCRAGVCVCVVHAFVNGSSCVRSLRERRASARADRLHVQRPSSTKSYA